MRISRLVSLLLILSILSQPLLVSAADTEGDFNSTKTHVNAIQIVNPSLPSVPQQRGRMGEIMSKLFDANGKIGNWYLKALGTRTDGAVLRWTGGDGGRFMTGSIFDDGTNVGIGTSNPRVITSGSKVVTIDGGSGTGPDIEFVGNNVTAGASPHGRMMFVNTVGNNDYLTSMIGGYGHGSGQDAGQLIFYTKPAGGSSGNRMTIDPTGNVGIGDPVPGFKLDVNGDINFEGDLYKGGVRYTAGGKFYDGTDPLDAVYTDGNVGIGTLVPSQPLDVVGNANISGTLTVGALSGDSITDGTIDDTELADGSVRTQEIANNTIVNADVNSAAAIAGTKISPNFGSQDIDTTGTIRLPNLIIGEFDGNTGLGADIYMDESGLLSASQSLHFNIDSDNNDTDRFFAINRDAGTAAATRIFTVRESGNAEISGILSVTGDPNTDDDVGDRGYNDARYINVGEAIPGDDIIDGTIDSSEIQNDTINASDLAPNSVASSELAGTLTYADNVGDAVFASLTIDHNASGADTLGADRNHRGLFVDFDSSASGGDTANEHRIYGVHSDVDVTGDSDLVYGGYFTADSNHSAGTISNLRGSYGYARSNSSAAVTNIHGAYNLGVDSSNGSVGVVWGATSKALKDSGSTNTTSTMIGQDGEVEIDAGTISSAYATRSIIDRDGGTINNGYLFYGDYQGTQPTNAYGVYIVDAVDNYFAGDVNIATGGKLSLSGNTDSTYIMRNGGANGMEFFTSDTSRMFIADGGNIGIGDTNPSEKLEVEGTIKTSGQLWSAFGNTGTHRGILLENFDDSANANGVDVAAKLGGTEFRGLRWVQETPWTSGSAASVKDTSLEFGVLQNNVAITPVTIDSNGNLSVTGRVSVTGDPDSGDDVADRDYNDARYYNVGEAINGDVITDGTIDSSEIQNNTLTAADLATGSVGTDEIIDDTITETDISDSFVARDSNLLDGIDSASFVRSDANDTLSAQYIHNSSTDTNKFFFTRGGSTANEYLSIGTDDTYTYFDRSNDENVARIRFDLTATDTETGGGANANSSQIDFITDTSGGRITIDGNQVLTTVSSINGDNIQDNTIDESEIEDTFVARDSNLLDALDSTAFIRSDANDNVTAHTEWQDNNEVRLGAGADMRLYHDGTNSRIHNTTGDLYMRSYAHGNRLIFQGENAGGTNRNLIVADPDNEVGLYYAGGKRLATTSAGIDVTGTVTASDPTAASHLATKNYVDTLVTQGVTWKAPVESGNTVVGTWGACDAAKQSWTTYNKNDDIIYICDGNAWISIGSSASVPYATTTSAGKVQISGDLQGTWNNINLKDSSVDSAAIANQSIVREDIATSEIYSNHIFNGTILSEDIATDTITVGNIAANAVGNSELINTDDYTVRSLTATDGNGIMWEDGVNRITHNDGGGNVQIRFGHDYTSSDERFTHAGSAFYIGGDLDDAVAGSANLDFKVSSNGGAGNDTAVTWGKVFRIGDNELTWDGDTILTDASNVDADTLDTLDSTQFLRSDVADTMLNELTISNATYGNHLKFERSGHEWEVSPSTDGSLNFTHPAGGGQNRLEIPGLDSIARMTAGGVNVMQWGDSGDNIQDGTIDSTEIQDNTLTASDLAANSVGDSELIDTPTVTSMFVTNTASVEGWAGYLQMNAPNSPAAANSSRFKLINYNRNGGNNLEFRAENDNGTSKHANILTIGTNGRVGVGTAAPGEKLSVSGRISVTSDPNSGDDVGDRDYNDARYLRGNTSDTMNGALTISRNAQTAGANSFSHLELFSPDTGDANNEVSMRFHQGNRYYNQIRVRSGGFRFTAGNDDTLSNISVATPTGNDHAATKSYVDGEISSLWSIADTNEITSSAGNDVDIEGHAAIGPNAGNPDTAVALRIGDNDFGGNTNRSVYQSYFSQTIPTTTMTANRTSYGYYGDLINNKGGNTTSGNRSYGYAMFGRTRNNGANFAYDNKGGYFDARNESTAGATTIDGVFGQAIQNDGAGSSTVTNLRGVYGHARGDTNVAGDSKITNAYAVQGLTYAYEADITNSHGLYGESRTVNGDGGDITHSYGVRGVSSQDSDDGGIITNSYGGHFSSHGRDSAPLLAQSRGIYANASDGQYAYAGLFYASDARSERNHGIYIDARNGSVSNWSIYSPYSDNYLGGRLSIGTTSPSASLHINKSLGSPANPASGLAYFRNTNNGSAAHATLALQSNSSAAGDPFVSFDIAGEAGWAAGVDNSDSNKFKISRSWSSLTSNTALTIDTNNDLGVNVTNPLDKIHTTGSVRVEGTNPKYRLAETDTTNTNYQMRLNAGTLRFETQDDAFGTTTERMSLTNAGNLNITGTYYLGDGKEIVDFADSWLRLNQNGDFTSGTYTPNNLRVDGSIYVGSDARFYRSAANTIASDDFITTSSSVEAGRGSGGVAMTVNDGYGNANLTFNHRNGVPEQNGAAGRVEVNTDSTGTATMDFELKNNVTSGAAVNLTSIMRLQSDGRLGLGTTAPTGRLHINYTSDASLTSTAHGLTVGSQTAENLAIDGNEIVARNNGAASQLNLNITGGDVRIGTDVEVRAGQIDDVTCIGNCF